MDIKVQNEVSEVTKGIIIYAAIVAVISLFISKVPISIIMGVVFGSVIAILNFRLLALTIEKSVDMPPAKAQVYTSSRYLIRMFIVAAVVFVSVKNPRISVIGTLLGLVSTQIVIYVKKLIIAKINRKGV